MLTHLITQQVNGTSDIDIDKIYLSVSRDNLSTAGHAVHVSTTHLNTKQIFTGVTLQQCPLTLLTLKNLAEIQNIFEYAVKFLMARTNISWLNLANFCNNAIFFTTCSRLVAIAISPHVMSAPNSLQILRNGRFPTSRESQNFTRCPTYSTLAQ